MIVLKLLRWIVALPLVAETFLGEHTFDLFLYSVIFTKAKCVKTDRVLLLYKLLKLLIWLTVQTVFNGTVHKVGRVLTEFKE